MLHVPTYDMPMWSVKLSHRNEKKICIPLCNTCSKQANRREGLPVCLPTTKAFFVIPALFKISDDSQPASAKLSCSAAYSEQQYTMGRGTRNATATGYLHSFLLGKLCSLVQPLFTFSVIFTKLPGFFMSRGREPSLDTTCWDECSHQLRNPNSSSTHSNIFLRKSRPKKIWHLHILEAAYSKEIP